MYLRITKYYIKCIPLCTEKYLFRKRIAQKVINLSIIINTCNVFYFS